jgi:alkyl hydroperoxide reductase subunit AhpF
MVAQSVVHIDTSRQPYKVILESGLKFNARAVVIATGAQYARLSIEDADAFTGRGIYYNATRMEAQLCDSEEVIVVGGGQFSRPGRGFSCPVVGEGTSLRAFPEALRFDVSVPDWTD